MLNRISLAVKGKWDKRTVPILVIYLKNKIFPVFVVIAMIAALSPSAFAAETADNVVSVSSWSDISDAMNALSGDVTFDLTENVTLSGGTATLTSDYTVTITSSNGSSLTLESVLKTASYLILNDINIISNGGYISVAAGGMLDVYNLTYVGDSSVSYGISMVASTTVNIYSAEISGFKTRDINNSTKGILYFIPEGNISIGKCYVGSSATCIIAPKSGSTVTYSYDTLEEAQSTTDSVTLSTGAAAYYNDLTITLDNSSAGGTTLSDFSPVNGTNSIAEITPPDSGWVEGENTFNVTCDSACVVAVKGADDSYTALTATLVEDNTYSFTVTDLTADTELVVAVKGDANGDGACDAADAAIAGAYSVGNIGSLSDLQLFLLDINKDDAVDGADSAVAKAVSVGNIDLTW